MGIASTTSGSTMATAAALNGIPDNATLAINAGSELAMSAGAEIIGGLTGAGNITTNSLAGTLTRFGGHETLYLSQMIGLLILGAGMEWANRMGYRRGQIPPIAAV